MKGRPSRILLLTLLLAILPASELIASPLPERAQQQDVPGLEKLRDLQGFQALFNQDVGRPRLILLLSPT